MGLDCYDYIGETRNKSTNIYTRVEITRCTRVCYNSKIYFFGIVPIKLPIGGKKR